MKTKHRLKSILFKSFLFLLITLMNGCDSIGNQAEQWQSGMFSPDGKYYVYTYGQVFVTQYQKRGGATFSSGILTSYLQVIDCATGNKLLEKPMKSKEMIRIETIEGNQVALWSYKIGDSEYSPAVFDLGLLKMKFSAEDLKKLNPTIPLYKVNTYYKNTGSQPGIIFEGDDGRKELINPNTGMISLIEGDFPRIDDKSSYCYQVSNTMKGYSTTNGTRRKITKGSGRNLSATSADDFLDPEFLMIDKSTSTDENDLTIYKNNLFILSPISTSDKKRMQITMLDQNTLSTKWTVEIPQQDQQPNIYNKERFMIQGNKLYVANSTNVSVIDMDQGTLAANYILFQK